ncbi:MAG: sensor histidine kinase [Bacteroidetes bacterium]|nr:sensor histidine kinase [Bacteroidota bacterium]
MEKPEDLGIEIPKYKNGGKPSALLYVIIIIITIAAIYVTIFLCKKYHRETVRLVTDQFNRQQLILARSAAAGIGCFMVEIEDEISELSNFPAVQKMEPGMFEEMEILFMGIPRKTSLRRLDKNGILRFIYPGKGWRKDLIGQDYSHEIYFQKARESGKTVISGLIINEIGEQRVRVAKPVYIEDETGTRIFNGIIIGSFDPKKLCELYISPLVSGETGYAWLLNEEGYFITHYEQEFIGKNAFSVRKNRNTDISFDTINNIQRKMMAGKEGLGCYMSGWHRGEKGKIEKIIAYTPVRVFDKVWSVAVCAPTNEVEKITSKAYQNDLYSKGFIILILIAAGVSLFIVLYRWTRCLEQEIGIRKQAEEKLKKNEKQLRKLNATKDKFFSIIAHDLINPFNGIIGFTDLLISEFESFDSKEIKELINVINKDANETYNLLKNLLDWSCSQRGNIEIKPATHNLIEIIENVVKLISFAANKKEIMININLDQQDVIFCDYNTISTVFRNLLSNGVKFTHRGGEISVTSKKTKTGIAVSVSDNGIGMKKEDIEEIFEIDSEMSKKGTENEKGTGLGLILCKEFVELNNGKICVTSEQGKGSVFTIILPQEGREGKRQKAEGKSEDRRNH